MQLPMKLGLGGGGLFLGGLLSFVLFPEILKFGIRDQTALKNRNQMKKWYLKLPIPLDFRIYFFNVTNPEEVHKGSKPILKEVGPYCYDLYKEKIDIIENEQEDSLTYSPFDIYKFNKERSGSLSDEDYVTVLHPLIVGMVNQVTQDSPALLSIVNKAIDSIFQEPKNIYLTTKVKDVLFDGLEINCRVKDFSSKAVCTQLKQQQIPAITEKEKGLFLFSLLGARNATTGKRFKVLRGIKKSKDLGKLVEFDEQKSLNIWGSKFCNRFKGTDGWIFPPLLPKEEGIWSFSTDLCRNIQAVYVKEIEFKGLPLREYEANLGDMDHVEEDKCYCPPKGCLKKGVFDLNKCMGVPLYATLPHFLETDEMYLKQVDGLSPDSQKHMVRIRFEYLTGSPVEARKRMQFNLPIAANNKINLMKNIPTALHPIFWVEEGIELRDELFDKVCSIFLIMKLLEAGKYIMIVAGLGVIGGAGYLHFKNTKSVKITPVHDLKNLSNGNNEAKEVEYVHAGNTSATKKGDDTGGKGYVNHAMSNDSDKY